MFRRGTRLGKYRLERRIGEGAFAAVWRARDTVEGRGVALKIALDSAVEAHGRDELQKEAQIAVRLAHPNIVAIRNADWIDGHFVLATELARRHLGDYSGARRSGRVALRVIRDIAAGLAHAHSLRVMHRDVKPENILIFADGRAALGDFGASRFTRGATREYTEAGTLGYMAPEQAYGRPTLSSDVFSLGLIAVELLAGALPAWPFDWPPPGMRRFEARVPAVLWPVLRKAAEFEPERRYPDAGSFARALESAFARLDAAGRKRVTRRRPRRPDPTPLAVQSELFRRRHGARLEMRFRCSRCDGAVAESMPICPWCGYAENSFAEITPYPLVCPDCERGVRAEWKACPWCYSGRLQSNGRKPRHDPKAERRCARRGCDGQLRRFMRYCPLCKQKPGRPWRDPELSERCPRCRGSISRAFWPFCPWCGRRESAGSALRRRA